MGADSQFSGVAGGWGRQPLHLWLGGGVDTQSGGNGDRGQLGGGQIASPQVAEWRERYPSAGKWAVGQMNSPQVAE